MASFVSEFGTLILCCMLQWFVSLGSLLYRYLASISPLSCFPSVLSNPAPGDEFLHYVLPRLYNIISWFIAFTMCCTASSPIMQLCFCRSRRHSWYYWRSTYTCAGRFIITLCILGPKRHCVYVDTVGNYIFIHYNGIGRR